MSTKLPGGSNSELTKLKRLWRDSLSEDARGFWREQFASESKQAEIRALIFKKLEINLRWDKQLTAFRGWVDDQDARDLQAERMQENEQRLKDEHPNWTLDQVRDEVLRQSYFEALATGDFDSGRKTIVQDLNVKKVALDERKLVILEKKAAAFDKAKGVLENKELTEAQRAARMREVFGVI